MPSGLNAGCKEASAAAVVSGRMPWSWLITRPSPLAPTTTWGDLAIEPAVCLGFTGASLRSRRELVGLLSSDVPDLRDHLGGESLGYKVVGLEQLGRERRSR